MIYCTHSVIAFILVNTNAYNDPTLDVQEMYKSFNYIIITNNYMYCLKYVWVHTILHQGMVIRVDKTPLCLFWYVNCKLPISDKCYYFGTKIAWCQMTSLKFISCICLCM